MTRQIRQNIQKTATYSCFFTLLFFSAPSLAETWKWAGFEVIGNHEIAKTDILNRIPITVGDHYKVDTVSWNKWCTDLKSHFEFHFTECSAVRYIDFQAFFVIEIVERGDEDRNRFRAEPTGSISLASPEILELYERLYKLLWQRFDQGIGVQESSTKGYLDYADTEMHAIVEQLIKRVPKYRENLLEVLAKDKDVNKREKAANLLNWTINDLSASMVRASRLLDDPSSLVRNNISRFTMHFLDKISSQQDRQGLIDRFLLQLERPSHGDRNKAIYNLLSLAHKFPEDRPYIRSQGLSIIESIATTSILDNVRDPAVELLKLVNSL